VLLDAPGALEAEASVVHRALVERDGSGSRLLKESGPLARLRVTAHTSWAPAGRLEVSAGVAHAQLDYAGHTQAGAPLSTTSRHDELEAGARWLPSAPWSWGEPAVTVDALRFRRAIAATASASALTETSTMVLPGLAWTSPSWNAGGAQWALRASWRTSVSHRLHVDYAGVLDASSLPGGRRNDLTLGATVAWPGGWSLSLEARRGRQQASAPTPLFSAGLPAGTVRQPRIALDDVMLALAKRF
jgi:hypothetical protein